MNKPLRYTTHCETVMAERQIERHWVEMTVRQPNWTEADPSGPPTERHFCRIPERDNRILRVVCLETETEIRIITAFLDRKAREPQ
jgi:Domain of unknown function (DUF4258)